VIAAFWLVSFTGLAAPNSATPLPAAFDVPLLEEPRVGWSVLLGLDVTPDVLAGTVLKFESLLRLLGGWLSASGASVLAAPFVADFWETVDWLPPDVACPVLTAVALRPTAAAGLPPLW